MISPSDVLSRALAQEDVERLHRAGLLTPAARDAALNLIRPSLDWRSWLRLRLLFLGSALLLCGIVFFFAYNWSSLGRVAKLGIVQGGLVAAAAAAALVGQDRLPGRVLLLAANVMTGVTLAVVGQIYQTGADVWELFAGWSAFTFGWVLISRFAAHWILWLVVTHVAAILWWEQLIEAPASGLCLLLAVLDTVFLVLRQVAVRRSIEWASVPWTMSLLWMATLGFLSVPPVVLIVEHRFVDAGPFVIPGAVGWIAAVTFGVRYFRHKAPDFACLVLAAMSMATVALTLAGRVIFQGRGQSGHFLLFGVTALVVIGGLAVVLRKAWLDIRKVARG